MKINKRIGIIGSGFVGNGGKFITHVPKVEIVN